MYPFASGMINQDTMAVLVNAIYFDAKWKSEFLLADTIDRCFYSHPGLQCQKIPMMVKEHEFNYKFDDALESHILQIPYEVIYFILFKSTCDWTEMNTVVSYKYHEWLTCKN